MPVVESYFGRAEEKAILLEFIPPKETIICFTDALAFSQVMDNLVSNAVKYSPHNTHVWVEAVSTPHAVRIAVRDEGPGLSDEDQSRLFGKFARLSAQPTGGEHSTGLGLSIVKKMVESMNGKVWCDSEQGHGAVFVVELPGVTSVKYETILKE
jgi:signal transduction histidine kinase